VEFMCSVGLISATIIQALASGASGVLILHCGSSIEHYLNVSYGVEEIVKCTRDILGTAGINPNRVMLSSSVNNPEWVMNGFRAQLLKEGLEAYQSVKKEEIPGRIGRQLAHLSALSAQEAGKGEPSFLLKGKVLRAAGMSDTLEMLESARYLSNFLGIRLDHQNIEEAVLSSTKYTPESSLEPSPESSPKSSPEPSPKYTHPDIVPLPTQILDSLTRLSFDNLAVRVGIHRSCSSEDSAFFEPILAILDQIPGCEVVELEPMECGATGWCHPDASAREKALLVFGQAEESGVDIIIPTSADCLTHLRTCNFPGAWKYSSVETMDIYSFVIRSLKEEEGRE
ncbi:MAG: hydrogenase iron-sulfur subunit, partial [Thermoplasmata archaeon]|nr:hydrogenase iron-sulfur subunit [Thermoplasmata archaeon]